MPLIRTDDHCLQDIVQHESIRVIQSTLCATIDCVLQAVEMNQNNSALKMKVPQSLVGCNSAQKRRTTNELFQCLV